jgi:hypothetical protein
VSEAVSPQPWGQEHSIDLGAVEAPVSARIPEPSPPNRHRFVPNIALAYVAIAIALSAAVVTAVKWSPLHRPVAESAVLSYLEAVRDGDVEGALAYTDQKDIAASADAEDTSGSLGSSGTAGPNESTEPSGSTDAGDAAGGIDLGGRGNDPAWDATRGEYLAPEALDTRWEIVTVAQVGFREHNGGNGATAEVYAEIEAYDGSRVGHRYQVTVEHGKAEIKGAVPETEAWGALDYLDMNGVRIETDPNSGFTNIYILPGLYEFYPDLPPTIGIEESSSMLVLGDAFLSLGDDAPGDWLPAPLPSVTQEGEDAVNAALRSHFDACGADPSGEGCPFGFPEDQERELVPVPGATWEITLYPRVSSDQLWYELGIGYSLQTAVPGEARVLAQITEDGQERTALVSCPVWVNGLYAHLDAEGGATISDPQDFAPDRCRSIIEVE